MVHLNDDSGYQVPGDPGRIQGGILKVWYGVEDWWLAQHSEDRVLLSIALLALGLMIYTLRYGPLTW